MLQYVPWDSCSNIVELGGGVGTTTRTIIKRKPDSVELTSCEIQKDRYEALLAYQDDTTKIVHLDAKSCLETFAPNSVDVVVSTLPLGSMPGEVAREILESIQKSLSKDGVYLQYQYFATNKEDIERLFTIVETNWEIINFPPAFIYVCKKR